MRLWMTLPAAVSCAALSSLAPISFAGPLDPPAGPIAPTHKTLTQVEPRTPISAATTPGDADSVFRISAPGSYYLTGNVAGEAGKRGIEIASNDVSIDLCGFAMIGGGATSLEAIGDSSNFANLTVKNGTISGWGAGGLRLDNSRGCLVSALAVRNVVGVAIDVQFNSVVSGCTVDDIGGLGPTVAGIRAGCCTVIESCHVDTLEGGASDGIVFNDGCVVRNCVINNTGGAGIRATSAGNVIESCSVIIGAAGISLTSGSTVRNCAVNGITGGAAIHATGTDNRIESNNVRASTRGLHVTGSGNILLGNSASGNGTNFDIAAGNIGLFMSAVTGGAFSGNAGGVSPGSNDNNTNYSY